MRHASRPAIRTLVSIACTLGIASAASAQQAPDAASSAQAPNQSQALPLQLPEVVVEAPKPPPIARPTATDPGPAAQARAPSQSQPSRQAPRQSGQVPPQQQTGPVEEAAGSDGLAEAPIVVSADRGVSAIGATASAITVVGPAEIERARGTGASVEEVLRGVPGLAIRRSGGIGGGTDISIRGADSDQTLVMIDGIPVNDSASAQGGFDFSVLSLANVARVEVLRGPQSGLYGGDAIGGVINIITRQGSGPPRGFAEIEGGSFGTFGQRGGVSGSSGRLSYAIGLSNFYSSGFSRRSDDNEADSTRKQAISAHLGYQISDTLKLGARFGYYGLEAEIDQLSTSRSDAGNTFDRQFLEGALSATLTSFGGALETRAVLFANQATRDVRECRNLACSSRQTTEFAGERYGAEITSTVKVRDGLDRLTLGGRILNESGAQQNQLTGGALNRPYDISETHRAIYAGYGFSPFERLSLSFAGRLDDFGSGDFEGTYRLSAAFSVPETGSKLRASFGTGIKAPTIFQRFDATFGNAGLETERSRGFDIGLDQSLLAGRAELSITYFDNKIDNLIIFVGSTLTGTYENVDAAETKGVEVAGEWRMTDWARFRAAYTYLDAIDATTGARLRQRPEHEGKVTLAFQPVPAAYLAATAVFQSDHFNLAFLPSNPGRDRQQVEGFVRFDLDASYDLSDEATVFVRAENVTDEVYEVNRGFNTPRRSAYGGVRVRF